jgi:tetratricopeptide (TPR) repeat protein
MGTSDNDETLAPPAAPRAKPHARSGRLQRHRKLVLLAFSLVLTLVIVGSIEFACRIAGFGGYRPTFVEAGRFPDGSALIVTDHGGPNSYFFTNRSNPGSLDPTAFVSPKPAKTFRIVIVGESAAKGNPYIRPLSAGAILQRMLADQWPDRQVEVINLGVTAVASFPVLGILTEALDHEPDLVIAYLGNNEFYGAYGVASLHSAGRSPWMIRLIRATRSLGIAQLIDSWRPAPPNTARTLMETMMGQSSIAPDDPLRSAAERNLETFVGAMVDRCAGRGVPIVVCTPPSNERDLAPLGAPSVESLGDAERAKVQEFIERARGALPADPAAALALIDEALHLAPNHATVHYVRGQALLRADRKAESASAFRKAVDLDSMPWRPPSSSVEAIRRAARAGGGILCDLEAAFHEASPEGSTGWELMDDHVHASLRGQFLIARSIAEKLATAPFAAPVDASRLPALASWESYAARLGDNVYERFAASHAMRLLAGVPFFQQTNPGFLEHHQEICTKIERSASIFARMGMQQWLDVTTHATEERPISGWVAEACLQNGAFDEAARLFRCAHGAVLPYGTWDLEYTYKSLMASVKGGHRLDAEDLQAAAKAIERASFLIAHDRSPSGAAEFWAGLLHQIRGELEPSITFFEGARPKLPPGSLVTADEALVRAYRATGRADRAAAIIDEGLRGPNANAYRALMRQP